MLWKTRAATILQAPAKTFTFVPNRTCGNRNYHAALKHFRSRAPLRLGLAGGGSDVSPFSDQFGGAILNATIGLYSQATILPRSDGSIVFRAVDRGEEETFEATDKLPTDGGLILHRGVYNRVVAEFANQPMGFELITWSDAPPGSGLGTSSTLVVAILGAFVEWLKLPLGEYDIAHLAYEIEREDLAMAGGKQDQYAATFGGVNFMEFTAENVIVNPLRIKEKYLSELEHNLVLLYTNTSRLSAEIISKQVLNVEQKRAQSVDAMHQIKAGAYNMKEALLKGQLDEIGELLHQGWQHKKAMADGISNERIDHLYDTALAAGATGGKISGAGGGGYLMFYCPGNTRFNVIRALEAENVQLQRFNFATHGLTTWKI